VVDELPMTATGKKMHFKVAELAAEAGAAGELDAPA
jgi:acyl-coenzyme A synthetase/AMP-(fatty) acid ligase